MAKIFQFLFFIGIQFSSFATGLLPDFTAAYNSRKKAVIIKWQHAAPGIKTYVVQCSANGKTWVDIAVQQINPATANRSFYFEDKKPAAGENYYRLACIKQDEKTTYSLPVMVIIGTTNNWAMYPVPVTDLLTLEYRGTEPIMGVINVVIQQVGGSFSTKLRFSSLSKQIKIPVSNLSKGMYDVRIIVQDEIIWNQRFIK